ncbi:hypothetical protein [Fibrisoma montanum]|nr:hypothetical protein [Fibrisoma montanum]
MLLCPEPLSLLTTFVSVDGYGLVAKFFIGGREFQNALENAGSVDKLLK